MWIMICHLHGKDVYNLLGTIQYVVVERSGDPSNGRPPTAEELSEIRYHLWYVSQLYGGRYGL